jgi:F-type H+-transporting ATPase subunit a
MSEGITISLSPDTLWTVFSIPITNTLVMSMVVFLFLVVFTLVMNRSMAMVPSRKQVTLEILFTGAIDYMTDVLESEKLARQLFPLIITIFLFIFTANMIAFIPGVGSLGVYGESGEFTELLRSMNTDVNVTFALAIISFLVIEILGVTTIGFLKYSRKFVNLSSVLGFFTGVIELFSEVARLISFSFRLFGNIFAGWVLLLVIKHFVPLVLPVPMLAFEVFIGFIQAAIFALLTLFFIKIAITEPQH